MRKEINALAGLLGIVFGVAVMATLSTSVKAGDYTERHPQLSPQGYAKEILESLRPIPKDWEVPYLSCQVGVLDLTKDNAVAWGATPENVAVVVFDVDGDGRFDAAMEFWPGEAYATFYHIRTKNKILIYKDTIRDGYCNGLEFYSSTKVKGDPHGEV